VQSRRTIPVLVGLLVWCAGVGTATPARSDAPACQPGDRSSPRAELFVTDNTAVITDPGASQLQDGLQLFEMQADVTIAQNGAAVAGSTLVDGVFWSDELQQTSYERAREFHLCGADEPTLHTVAEALRRQFNQKSVLTFDYLPQDASGANAITIDVPDIDIARFRDALVADSAAHNRLPGGSVITTDHTLILVAGNGDLDIARRLVGEAGGCWNAATVAYGKREFVD
jgi:hypothetical protein